MFKARKNPMTNFVSETTRVVRDFMLRATRIGYESYRVQDIKDYDGFTETKMLPLLDSQMEKYLAGNNLDTHTTIS